MLWLVERACFIRVQSRVRFSVFASNLDDFCHLDEFDPKINVLSGSDKRKENELLSAINMGVIVNNRSVKTVRKLQVLLSLQDEIQQSSSEINKDFSTCRTLQ